MAPFAHAADVELDSSDVAVYAVLQHIASDELSVPDGYNADELGNLLAHNESESYERVLDDNSVVTTESDGLKKIEGEGRSKRRRIANTQYNDFWRH
jgi:hypothetical protein